MIFKTLQLIGLLAIAAGVGIIYLPAGIIVGGFLAFAAGELLSVRPFKGREK